MARIRGAAKYGRRAKESPFPSIPKGRGGVYRAGKEGSPSGDPSNTTLFAAADIRVVDQAVIRPDQHLDRTLLLDRISQDRRPFHESTPSTSPTSYDPGTPGERRGCARLARQINAKRGLTEEEVFADEAAGARILAALAVLPDAEGG